jgi:hypothetical protein
MCCDVFFTELLGNVLDTDAAYCDSEKSVHYGVQRFSGYGRKPGILISMLLITSALKNFSLGMSVFR